MHIYTLVYRYKRMNKHKPVASERLKFSLIIGDYWRVPEGSKFSGEKIISTGELLNFYHNINSTGGFSIPLE